MATLAPPRPPHSKPTKAPVQTNGTARSAAPDFRFEGLVLTEPKSAQTRRGSTLTISIVVHAALIAAVVIVPLLAEQPLPAPGDGLRAFFVEPASIAPPPPPPPPPAAGARAAQRAPAAPRPLEDAKFVAPIEVPTEIVPEESSLDFGVEGGVPGGVEGGVPGGVIGGIVGGLPQEAPPPPKAVRVGGHITAPKLVKRVEPAYPDLARQARASALIILEATTDVSGQVKDVRVLRGNPLFDAAAVEAVQQWRYRPLLLNGVPTPFVVTVTLVFRLTGPEAK